MTAIALVSGLGGLGISQLWVKTIGDQNLWLQLGEVSVGIAIILVIFFGAALALKLPEMDLLRDRVFTKLKR